MLVNAVRSWKRRQLAASRWTRDGQACTSASGGTPFGYESSQIFVIGGISFVTIVPRDRGGLDVCQSADQPVPHDASCRTQASDAGAAARRSAAATRIVALPGCDRRAFPRSPNPIDLIVTIDWTNGCSGRIVRQCAWIKAPDAARPSAPPAQDPAGASRFLRSDSQPTRKRDMSNQRKLTTNAGCPVARDPVAPHPPLSRGRPGLWRGRREGAGHRGERGALRIPFGRSQARATMAMTIRLMLNRICFAQPGTRVPREAGALRA